MWRWYFLWRYRRRERARGRRQLAGKYRPPERFGIFSRTVMDRSSFGKYDPRPGAALWRWLPAGLAIAAVGWFLAVSVRAWDIFQP